MSNDDNNKYLGEEFTTHQVIVCTSCNHFPADHMIVEEYGKMVVKCYAIDDCQCETDYVEKEIKNDGKNTIQETTQTEL